MNGDIKVDDFFPILEAIMRLEPITTNMQLELFAATLVIGTFGFGIQLNWPIKQVHVINLDRRPDRMENVRKQLEYLHVPFERFNAIDGRKLETFLLHSMKSGQIHRPEYIDVRWRHSYHWMRHAHPSLSRPEAYAVMGCMMSHFHTQLKAIDNVRFGRVEDGPVLIFEDDVSIDAEFVERVGHLINTLNEEVPDWGMFHLGFTMSQFGKRLKADDNIAVHELGFGAQGYVMRSVKYSQMMVDRANQIKQFIHNDCLWHHLQKNGVMKVFVYVPNTLVVQNQREFGSNLLGYWPGSESQRVRTPIVT